jgi:hypothetical protein
MNDTEIVKVESSDIEKKLQDFSKLIEQVTSLDDKRRSLWLQIYENAICDRHNAYIMFSKLVKIVNDSKSPSTDHAVHGKTLSTYIERMAKANDQLIKLCELVDNAVAQSEEIDPNKLFDEIGRS